MVRFPLMTRLAKYLCLALLAFGLIAATAVAATKNGITPLAPKEGATVKKGTQPTFRMRVRGSGKVYVYVCDSRERNADGLICHDQAVGDAKKRNGIHIFRPRLYDYPSYWLNEAGTYYWQAHRIDCTGSLKDCAREGPIVKFQVR